VLVTIQFPLADSRSFLDYDTGKLARPLWPAPLVDEDFIRSFGIVRRRWSGGLGGWIGEADVCDARRALRFDPPAPIPWAGSPDAVPVRIVFRRFYADGLALAKLEVGFVFSPPGGEAALQTLPERVLRHLLELPVRIPVPDAAERSCRLWQAGSRLAQLYRASSSRSGAAPAASANWQVQSGLPILLVEYASRERASVPFPGREVKLSRYSEALLSHHLIRIHGKDSRLWLVNNRQLPSEDARRTLRITLLRLHAEKECLRRILAHVATSKIQPAPCSAASDALQHYLNDATRRIFRLQGGDGSGAGQPGDEQLLPAFEAEEAISAGEREAILQSLARIQVRPQIYNKVERIVTPGEPILVELRDILVTAYPTEPTARQIATQAGFAEGTLPIGQPNMRGWWWAAIEAGRRQAALLALVDAALGDPAVAALHPDFTRLRDPIAQLAPLAGPPAAGG
jgi:hypothetical protein